MIFTDFYHTAQYSTKCSGDGEYPCISLLSPFRTDARADFRMHALRRALRVVRPSAHLFNVVYGQHTKIQRSVDVVHATDIPFFLLNQPKSDVELLVPKIPKRGRMENHRRNDVAIAEFPMIHCSYRRT